MSHRRPPVSLCAYGVALLMTALVALLGLLLREVLRPEFPGQISGPLFFAAVVLSTRFGGQGPGLLAASLSVLVFEYLFTPPLHSLHLGWKDVPRMAVYLLTLVLTGSLLAEWERAARGLHRAEERENAARLVQQGLFPAVAPVLPGLDLAGVSYPAEAAGGDYFDYVPLRDSGLGLVVGDVSGHGLDSALLMAETRAYLRALALSHDDPGEILTLTNRILTQDTEEERFITLFLGRLDIQARTLVYAGAGHGAYLLETSGEVRRLRGTSMPLGLEPDLAVPCAPPVRLEPGQVFVLFTDGVYEAQSPAGGAFGLGRALDVVRANRHRSASEILDTLYETIQAFALAQPHDDITLVVLKVQLDGPAL